MKRISYNKKKTCDENITILMKCKETNKDHSSFILLLNNKSYKNATKKNSFISDWVNELIPQPDAPALSSSSALRCHITCPKL